MTNVHGVFEIEMFGQRREIISIMIHVMTACCLSGATVPAAIMRDNAEAFAEKEKHLRIPIVRRKRPTMTKHNRLAAAPVFVKDVDVCSVFLSDRDVWHARFPFGFTC